MSNNSSSTLLVSIVGLPNSGKSTLLNYFIGQKISIVTPKIQTTRCSITGIMTKGSVQIVFIDTPGIFQPKKPLERAMVRCAWSNMVGADLVLLMIDSSKPINSGIIEIIERMTSQQLNFAIVFNKVDLLKNQQFELENHSIIGSNQIFKISAKTGLGVNELEKYLKSNSLPKPWLYDGEDITTVSMRFLAQEITREKLFLELYEEVPYNLTVETEKWEELKDGSVKLHQAIIVNRNSHRVIILGKAGQKIKSVGQKAREAIGQALGIKVHLFLFVKVEDNWEENSSLYENMGLKFVK